MKTLFKPILITTSILVLLASIILVPNDFAMTSAITGSEQKIAQNLESAFEKYYERDFAHFSISTEDNGYLIFAEIIIKNMGNNSHEMRADITINDQEHTVFYKDDTVYSNLGGVKLKFENINSINDALEHQQVLDNIGEMVHSYSVEYSNLLDDKKFKSSLELSISPFVFGQRYEIIDPVEDAVEKTIVVDMLNNVRKIKLGEETVITIKNLYQKPSMNFPDNFDDYGMF